MPRSMKAARQRDARGPHRRPIVIAGATKAGLTAAEHLVDSRWDGQIIVVGAGTSQSRQYRAHGVPPVERACVAPDDVGHCDNGIDWRPFVDVVHTDIAARVACLADGTQLHFSGLIIAADLMPLRLPGDRLDGTRHVVHSPADARRMHPQLHDGDRVVIIGAGSLGCEMAMIAAARGCKVTVVDSGAAPMSKSVGVYVGNALRRHHTSRGIRMLAGTDALAITAGRTSAATVVLLDEADLPADVVIECMGSRTDLTWLAGNGLDLADGVLCNADLSLAGAPDAVAVGEIARFPNLRFDRPASRIGHRQAIENSARHGADTLLAALRRDSAPARPFAPLPTFCSVQGDLQVDIHGVPGLGDRKNIVQGNLTGGAIVEPVVVEYLKGREPVGIVTLNTPAANQAPYLNTLADATATVARSTAGGRR